jgi:hypothetical protein
MSAFKAPAWILTRRCAPVVMGFAYIVKLYLNQLVSPCVVFGATRGRMAAHATPAVPTGRRRWTCLLFSSSNFLAILHLLHYRNSSVVADPCRWPLDFVFAGKNRTTMSGSVGTRPDHEWAVTAWRLLTRLWGWRRATEAPKVARSPALFRWQVICPKAWRTSLGYLDAVAWVVLVRLRRSHPCRSGDAVLWEDDRWLWSQTSCSQQVLWNSSCSECGMRHTSSMIGLWCFRLQRFICDGVVWDTPHRPLRLCCGG